MNKKNNKMLLIILLAFVVLIGGAYVLYNRFSDELKPDMLLTENGSEDTGKEKEEQNEGAEEKSQESQGESEGAEEQSEAEKIEAPDFTVTDIDGNEVRLSDFKGKPVVLNFWASWCGPCKSEMPAFDTAYADMGEDVAFLLVNMTDGSRETVDTASAYVEEQGFQVPVYYDTEISAAIAYGVSSLPTTYFIDTDGFLVARAAGAIDGETLQKGIDMIFP